jgi:2-dehydropantoate 2-reductase
LNSIAVIGAGAVGGYFAAMLSRAGADVTLVARAAQAEAIARDGLAIVEAHGEWHVRVRATRNAADIRDARLVLVAVKSHDTEAAATQLRPHLHPEACVVSLQNGADNAQRIAAIVPAPVYAAVVYVGVDVAAPGRILHTGGGELLVGLPRAIAARGTRQDLERIAQSFEGAGVPCSISDDIDTALWSKLVMNCAFNAISALTRSRYRAMAADTLIRELMARIVRETVEVARADGVRLDAEGLIEAAWKLAASMPDQQSSTAQDLQRGKRTEIDALNGFVARRAAALGIEAPLNLALHALVKACEAVH